MPGPKRAPWARRASHRRTRALSLWALALALAATGGVDRRAARLNNEANRLFEAKEYDAAAERYDDAQTRAPESPEIAYNLGNTLFRQGKLADAVARLQHGADSGDPRLRQQSWYNLGNALHGMQKLPEAVSAYRHALALDPHDRDAKINYEKAFKELQSQQQQNQQGQQGQQGQNQGQGQDQQNQSQSGQDERNQNQNQDQQRNQEQQQSQQEQARDSQSQSQQENADQTQQEPPPQFAGSDSVAADQLSREEAVRILEAMREQEKELQAERARKRVRTRRVDKDW